MKIAFRTNAGQEGLGHLNRTVALYRALRTEYPAGDLEGSVTFYLNEEAKPIFSSWLSGEKKIPDIDTGMMNYDIQEIPRLVSNEPDILVVDTYNASSEYIRRLNDQHNGQFLLFDDNNDLYRDVEVDVLINGNVHARELDYEATIDAGRLFLGPKFLAMNEAYWSLDTTPPEEITTILVTCGGADPLDIMQKLAKQLRRVDKEKRFVIGPYFKDHQIRDIREHMDGQSTLVREPNGLKDELIESDAVITAAGSTVYEALTTERYPVIYVIGNDQELIADSLTNKGVRSLGDARSWDGAGSTEMNSSWFSASARAEISHLFDEFDGQGAQRIAEEL